MTNYSDTEAQFQDTIIELAKVYGWKVHAERPAQTNKGGELDEKSKGD